MQWGRGTHADVDLVTLSRQHSDRRESHKKARVSEKSATLCRADANAGERKPYERAIAVVK